MHEMKEIKNRVMIKLLKSLGFNDDMEITIRENENITYKAYEDYDAMSGCYVVKVCSRTYFESDGEECHSGWDFEEPMMLSAFVLMPDESTFEKRVV